MTPEEIQKASGIKQAYLLQSYIAKRYDIHLPVGKTWALLDDLPDNPFAFEIALNSRLNEQGYFYQDGQNSRDYEKLDPVRVTVRLHMSWGGEPFDDFAPVHPRVARSKLFKAMTYIKPIDGLAALVGGES